MSKNQQLIMALKNSGWHCWYCGKRLTRNHGTSSDATLDHLIPQVNGGGNHPSNLVAACRSCNATKHSGTIEAMRDKIARRIAEETAGRPKFTKGQIEWLNSVGIYLPPLPRVSFWFETGEKQDWSR